MKEYTPIKEGKVREIYDAGDTLVFSHGKDTCLCFLYCGRKENPVRQILPDPGCSDFCVSYHSE